MMDMLASIFSIIGLTFLIKESDGPFGILNWTRNALMRNKYFGVFFFKLLSCSFCVGCHSGWIVYLLSNQGHHLNDFILWSLAGGSISLLFEQLLLKPNAS